MNNKQVVSYDLYTRINKILLEGIAKLEKHYGVELEMPKVLYTLRGTTGGRADYRKWTVNYNAVLLNENVDVFLARTVPHELAHLACDKIYPQAHETDIVMSRTGRWKRTKRDVHGRYWQEIMRVLGVKDISRCHSYDVTNSKIEKTFKKFNYSCGCGVGHHKVGAKVHNKISLFNARYTCRVCKQVLVSANSINSMVVKPAPTPVVKKKAVASTNGTKIERARGILASMHNASQKTVVEAFMSQLDMTQAGARTYYYNLTK